MAKMTQRTQTRDVACTVLHTVLIKTLRDTKDGDLELDCTCIQRAIHPAEVSADLQFSYRINDKVQELHERKRRLVNAMDDGLVVATCTTFSTSLPLTVSTVFSMYPFVIRLATCKIELTSYVHEGATGEQLTLRPDMRNDTHATGDRVSVVMIKDTEALDTSIQYGLASDTPIVYGKLEKKQDANGDNVTYTPIVNVGFYIIEPAIVALVYMLAPVAVIFIILTSVHEEDVGDFRAHLGTLTVALIFALTQGNLRHVSRSTAPSSFLSPADAFVLVIFIGLAVAAVDAHNVRHRFIGIVIGWSAFVIPLVGGIQYNLCLHVIRSAGRGLDFAREVGKEDGMQSAGKEKGEAFWARPERIGPIPSEEEVPNSTLNLFPGFENKRKKLFSKRLTSSYGAEVGLGGSTGGGAVAASGYMPFF